MSHHLSGVLQPRPAGAVGRQDAARHPGLYLLSTPLPHLQRLLLATIAHTVIGKRPCTPSQERLGELLSRSRETINRALRALVAQRLIFVKRRGRRLTNVYLLARRIWAAITGKQPPYPRDRQLQMRYEAGRSGGLTPWRAAMGALGYG